MMTNALILAGTAIAITAMLCLAAGRAWRGWLELKRTEMAAKPEPVEIPDDDIGMRIELAAVRERLRKLEAIASVVEL
jgi:hypothetical protein